MYPADWAGGADGMQYFVHLIINKHARVLVYVHYGFDVRNMFLIWIQSIFNIFFNSSLVLL